MTPADRHTIVRARRWARANGWSHTAGCWTSPDGNLRVTWYPDAAEVGVARRHTADLWGGYEWLKADSAAQAIDVLVAYRVLPPHLSSAYAAGVVEGAVAYATAYETVRAHIASHIYDRDEPTGQTPAGVELEPLGGRHG